MQNGRIYTKALFNDGNPQERLPRSARNDEYHQSPRRVQAPLVLARNVSDTAISPSPRPCEEQSDEAILAGFPSLRGALAPWQSWLAPRHCEQSEAILSAGKDCFTLSGFAMTAAFKKAEISTDRTGIHILFWILLYL